MTRPRAVVGLARAHELGVGVVLAQADGAEEVLVAAKKRQGFMVLLLGSRVIAAASPLLA